MKRLSLNPLFTLLSLLFLSAPPLVLADRGVVPLEPNASVYEPGQKAIIAWNGTEEILILSTDINANESTWVLEILPLPSNPRAIEKASFESFVTLQDLIEKHAPRTYGRGYGDGEQAEGVEVVFHERMGAHDIAVVKAGNASSLAGWAEGFLGENGVSQEVSLGAFEPVIEDYMARGFRFFALDLIEVSPKENSVEPILYRFETSFLYYPLKITSPLPGETNITLFLLTRDVVSGSYHPLGPANYTDPLDPSFRLPIQGLLTRGELCLIDLRIGELLDGAAWFTVLEYKGPTNLLKKDLMMLPAKEGAGRQEPSLPWGVPWPADSAWDVYLKTEELSSTVENLEGRINTLSTSTLVLSLAIFLLLSYLIAKQLVKRKT